MKRFVNVCFAIVMTLTLIACSAQSNSTPNEDNKGEDNKGADTKDKVEIVVQTMITPNMTVEFFENAIQRFEEQNPDIKVKRINPPDTNVDKYLKTLLASGNFPDVIHNANFNDFVAADALMEIPIDDDIKKIRNYDVNFINGKYYNVFAFVQLNSLIYYNKDMFKQAGITKEPETWAEFDEVLEKLKAAGFTPMLTSGDWAGFGFASLSSPEIFGRNPVWYKDRHEGKVSFTDDNWIEAAKRYQSFVEKGYFYEGALSINYTQMQQAFLNGEAAMYPMGIWFTAAEATIDHDIDVGVFASPTKDGSKFVTGGENKGGFAISKTSQHPEAALRFVKFMTFDPETHKQYGKTDGLISNLVEPIYFDMTPLQEKTAEIARSAEVLVGQEAMEVGASPVPGIKAEYNKIAQNILAGKDAEEEMKKLEEFWIKMSQ